MKFYHNNRGDVAKLLITDSHAIIMFAFRTMFFDDTRAARRFLIMHGFIP